MTDKNKPPVIPPPTGTEDKAQLRALGEYMDKVARGEIVPAKPEDLGRNMVAQWGFSAEDRQKLERARAAREAASRDRQPPRP